MKVIKNKLASLNRAYATSCLSFNDNDCVVYASEATVGVPGDALAFPISDLNNPELIWNNAGGCMSVIQHPFKKILFLRFKNFI